MSATAITIDWGDGTYAFSLRIGELIELQEKCDAGPGLIAARLASAHWRVEDIVETIRLGLVGGGMEPGKAVGLVRRYVRERPLAENIPVAHAIIMAAIAGTERNAEPPPGEPAAETGGSTPPPSSEPEP